MLNWEHDCKAPVATWPQTQAPCYGSPNLFTSVSLQQKAEFSIQFLVANTKKRRVYSSAIQCQLCLSAYVRCDFFSQATKISGAGGGGQYNWMMRYLSGILLNLFLPFISFFFFSSFWNLSPFSLMTVCCFLLCLPTFNLQSCGTQNIRSQL